MKHKHSGVIIHDQAVETNNTRFFSCTIITTKTRGVIRANNVPLSIIQFPRETTLTQRGNLTVEEANGGAVSFFPRAYMNFVFAIHIMCGTLFVRGLPISIKTHLYCPQAPPRKI
jgi:hypothetical protein